MSASTCWLYLQSEQPFWRLVFSVHDTDGGDDGHLYRWKKGLRYTRYRCEQLLPAHSSVHVHRQTDGSKVESFRAESDFVRVPCCGGRLESMKVFWLAFDCFMYDKHAGKMSTNFRHENETKIDFPYLTSAINSTLNLLSRHRCSPRLWILKNMLMFFPLFSLQNQQLNSISNKIR